MLVIDREAGHDLTGFGITAALQVRISQVVHRMKFFSDIALLVRCRACRAIGRDGVAPETAGA